MKITVCKGCGQVMHAKDSHGEPACITCYGLSKDSGISTEVDMPEELICDYRCGSKAIWDNEKRAYIVTLSKKGGWIGVWGSNNHCVAIVSYDQMPFIDTKNKTFYCGCRGWD